MTSKGRLTMQIVLRHGFNAFYIRVDAKTRAIWSGVSVGYCRTALRRLVARGLIERTENGQYRVYGLTKAGEESRAGWWPKKENSK